MERLTDRLENGNAYVVSETGTEGTGYMPTQRRLPELIARLASYEDTGLTPEEINKLDTQLMSIPPNLYNPSQWRRYDFKICRSSQALASLLNKINKNGWVLVTVTQHRRSFYTVFFKRFISCQKNDDV